MQYTIYNFIILFFISFIVATAIIIVTRSADSSTLLQQNIAKSYSKSSDQYNKSKVIKNVPLILQEDIEVR